MAYVANSLVMVAIVLLFRYADFVTLLGGAEFHLGWIVGLGMVGSLLMRSFLGRAIDEWGPRAVWAGSLLLFSTASFGHLALSTCHGPAIYLLRIALFSAVAGIFGSAMTFISGRTSQDRMAELLGMLGTSGFVGYIVGSQLGDFLLAGPAVDRSQVVVMFTMAGLLALAAVPFALLATVGHPLRRNHRSRRRLPMLGLVRRYQPGTVILVGMATGAGLHLPGIFLRPFAAEMDIGRIGLFFSVYAPAAILTRVLTRRLPERLGLRFMILLGLSGVAVSQLLFLAVTSPWMLILPGIVYGFSHAILFPSAVAAASGAFPDRHRGLGTTFALATHDVGQLIGAPLAGLVVHYAAALGLPGFAAMFVTMASLTVLVAFTFAASPAPARLRSRHFRLAALPQPASAVVEGGTDEGDVRTPGTQPASSPA